MIRMIHDDPKATGGPTTADVPEEARGWMEKAGWRLEKKSEEKKPAPEARPDAVGKK